MEQKFKIGDVVLLKSGSPEMTISNIKKVKSMSGPSVFKGFYECKWFEGNNVCKDDFHQDALEIS